VLLIAVVAALEWNALSGTGQGRQKFLSTVSGTIHGGLALTLLLYLIGLAVNS